jgi:hypothetical protein
MKFIGFFVAILLLLVLPAIVCAADLDGYVFKKFSSEDQKAVLKTPQGDLSLVGVGDRVGLSATITQIFADYVELKQVTPQGPETLMVYVVDGK